MSTVADDVAGLDATAQAALVRTREVDAVELVQAGIAGIEALNPTLNAVITPTFERALDAVRVGVSGPFAGVPFLLKDLAVEMEGVRFCEGSHFLREHVSTYESDLVTRLRRAGLVILGKTNTPEFGMAPACEPERFGPTRNPWDPDRSTSGSSGGSAAAVASRMVPMAHADDLGGSIRYPASACGLFGLEAHPGPGVVCAPVRRHRARVGVRVRRDPLGTRRGRAARRGRGPGTGGSIRGTTARARVLGRGRYRTPPIAHRVQPPHGVW